jgi:hypothetical protein
MKPIAFFFTQYTDYSQLIKEQSMVSTPSTFAENKKKKR